MNNVSTNVLSLLFTISVNLRKTQYDRFILRPIYALQLCSSIWTSIPFECISFHFQTQLSMLMPMPPQRVDQFNLRHCATIIGLFGVLTIISYFNELSR